MGSSPHVRGAPLSLSFRPPFEGIIPACAGSTNIGISIRPIVRDHPRMCGEHNKDDAFNPVVKGSSPHVRGALQRLVCGIDMVGIIPACAGSTNPHCTRAYVSRDHPRMCGEHLAAAGQVVADFGIIPACAGSTIASRHVSGLIGDHPRMCGEHPSETRSNAL